VKREQRRIFGSKRGKWQETGENCIRRRFIICLLHKILLG
jgi:hypothetical protein